MKTIDPELQKYLAHILEQAKNGIIVSDPNKPSNPVIYVNDRTCELFEYTPEDFLGKNCSFLQGEDKNQAGLHIISQSLKKQKAATVTVRNYTKTGKLIYNQFTISPILDEKQELKYFLGIQRDVTNETYLKQSNKKLQDERIENAQYNAIGKLSGGISHEINTPLTIINGHMEMIRLSLESLPANDTKEIKEELEGIQNNLHRIKNITESMREIADIKSFEITDVNLFRIIISALRLTHNKAKNITPVMLQDEVFNLDIERDSCEFMIKGDFRKLQQLFIILIDNALDQLEASEFEENLFSINIVQNDTNTQITLYDNGGGIDEKIMKNIFKPFNSNKAHRGLGIGLSIAKKIIEEHNYTIDIQNDNKGVRVIITIPT